MKDFIEIERKYIIEKPNVNMLLKLPTAELSSIKQIYLESQEGVTHRVRSRRYESCVRFYETIKRRIDKLSNYEDEREISEGDFLEKSREIKRGTRPLIKDRISFEYCGKTIEIDIYPEWKSCAIMEIELSSPEEAVAIPDFIKIKREVTGIRAYSNASMSISFPKEDE